MFRLYLEKPNICKFPLLFVISIATVALCTLLWLMPSANDVKAQETPHCGDSGLPKCTRAEVHLTNFWSRLTTDENTGDSERRNVLANPANRKFVGEDTYLYVTARTRDEMHAQTNFIHRDADVLVVTVYDYDRNLPQTFTSETVTWVVDTSLGGGARIFFMEDSDSFIADINRDERLDDEADIVTVSGSAELYILSAYHSVGVRGDGVTTRVPAFEVLCAANCETITTFYIVWNSSAVDDTSVRVSITDGSGGTLNLRETGPDTGVFEGEIKVLDAGSSSVQGGSRSEMNGRERLTVTAEHASRITVSYKDLYSSGREDSVTARAVADIEPPEVSVLQPSHDSATGDSRLAFDGYFDDGGAGIAVNTARLVGDNSDDPDNEDAVLNFDEYRTADGQPFTNMDDTSLVIASYRDILDDDAMDGMVSLRWNYSARFLLGERGDISHVVDFVVHVSDLAGNIGFSDAEQDEQGPQMHLVHIDLVPPRFDDDLSVTGQLWNSSRRRLDKDMRDAIRLVFDTAIDPLYVQPEDFLVMHNVSGVVRVADVVFADPPEIDDDLLGDARTIANAERDVLLRSAFLHLETDLPSVGSVSVEIVGDLRDRAGNTAGADDEIRVVLSDGLAPRLAVELFGGSGIGADGTDEDASALTKRHMEVLVSADEPLKDAQVSVWQRDEEGVFVMRGYLRVTGRRYTHQMRAVFDAADISAMDGDVYLAIQAEDRAGNIGYLGGRDPDSEETPPTFLLQRDISVQFTLDTRPPSYTGENMEMPISSALVTLEWDEEVSVDRARLYMQDGEEVDMKDLLSSADGRFHFYVPPLGMPAGKHTLEARATDMAGNSSSVVRKVLHIYKPEPFELSLYKGWNAVSLPSDPVDTDVGDVFSTAAIMQVLTYEPWNRSRWKIAVRSGEDFFGDLRNIRGGVGYWVFSDTFTVQKVALRNAYQRGDLEMPANVRTYPGWNLIGVLDTSRQRVNIQGKSYRELTKNDVVYPFVDYVRSGGSDVTRAYHYDTLGASLEAVDMNDSEVGVLLGNAYWVYMDASAGSGASLLLP